MTDSVSINEFRSLWGAGCRNFTNQDLRGIDFREFEISGALFQNADLSGCVFDVVKGSFFDNATMKYTDFSEGKVSNSSFDWCDLSGANFENTSLDNVSFCGAKLWHIRIEGVKLLSNTDFAGADFGEDQGENFDALCAKL